MDQGYLKELIDEVRARDGGLILNVNGRPEAVVLSIEKYNQLISNSQFPMPNAQEQSLPASTFFNPKTVLVTGGAGYIGAHIARQLINAGHKVVIIDNLSTGKRENVPAEAQFIEGDCGDVNLLRDVFASEKFSAVMHLAASIEAEESVKEPAKYLENNSMNTARLLSAMAEAGIRSMIFSSSAAVYGEQEQQPILETAPLKPNNPYGYSKYLAEEIIRYYCEHQGFEAAILRYFNACGSDFDAQIKPTHESHLLAKIMQVLTGKEEQLIIHGNDYPTQDGTCIRDFVHVLDISQAHLLALNYVLREKPAVTSDSRNFQVFNIGTGQGTSVLEMVNTTAEVLNRMVPMQPGPRRPGDAHTTIADATKIQKHLGFSPKFSDLETIIKTAHRQMVGKSD